MPGGERRAARGASDTIRRMRLARPGFHVRRIDVAVGLSIGGWIAPLLAILLAAGLLIAENRERQTLRAQLVTRNRLKLAGMADAVENYLTHVGIMLGVIAAEPAVRALRDDSREFVQAIYEQNYAHHRLAEVYVVERAFDGSRRPLMTFEHGENGEPVEKIHSAEREAAEYGAQIAQLTHFAANPRDIAEISEVIPLCVGGRGVVYSVPIRDGAELRGLVAGMVPLATISRLLESAEPSDAVVVVREGGARVLGDWPGEAAPAFVAGADDALVEVGAHAYLRRTIQAGDARWHVVLAANLERQLAAIGAGSATPGALTATAIVALGGVTAVLLHTLAALLRARQTILARTHELARVARVTTMSELASGIAHELNQPLAAIANYAEAAAARIRRMDAPSADALHDLSAISAQAERAASIVERVRRFVRRRDGERAAHDLNTLVRQAVELIRPELRRLAIRLELDTPEGALLVHADDVLITQVILNLLRNAFEALSDGAPDDRIVRVRTASDANTVACTVEDNGKAISDEVFARLFETFHTTKRGGLGLGLAICRSIVDAHGGRIEASRLPAGGAAFRFTLPRATVRSTP